MYLKFNVVIRQTVLRLGVFILGLAAVLPATAQSESREAFDSFAKNQFYGNRIKAGSVLLSGTLQYTGYDDPSIDGSIGTYGIGLGLGLTEFLAVNFSFQQDNFTQLNSFTGQVMTVGTSNTFQAGVRVLPATVGGFIQPYTGIDYFTVSGPGDFESSGAIVPVGVIFWISTFMAVSIQPLTLSVVGNTAPDEDYNAEFSVNLNMLNPTFGISFLLNAKRP